MRKVKTSTEKLPVTTKKQKFVGFKEFIDAATGEIIPMQINQVEDRDFNFHKLWLQMFINGLNGIVNKKMKLAFWIIDHLNKENQLVYTFKRMAEETGLSEYTVILTMKELQNGDPPFLKKLQSGVYVVNPDILYKGSHQNRMGVIYQFGSLSTPKQVEQIKKLKNGETRTSSVNAPESPETHETPSGQENIPGKPETPQNGQNETELAELKGTAKQIMWAEKIREKFYRQFKEQIPLYEELSDEPLKKLFATENRTRFWIENRDKNLENLPR